VNCEKLVKTCRPTVFACLFVDKDGSAQILSPLVPEMLVLFWGFISGILIALPLTTLLNEPDILVGFVEEPAKAIGVAFLALRYPESISTKTRGLTLGGLAGLGFAVQENMWYFLGGTGAQLYASDILLRTVMDVPLHVMFSGIVALGLVYLAQKQINLRSLGQTKMTNVLISEFSSKDVASFILLAMILHGVFDATADYLNIGPFPLMFFIVIFVYYRLWRVLPEKLGSFKFPGFIGLLGAIIGSKPLVRSTNALSPPESHGSQVQAAAQIPPGAQSVMKFCLNCGQKIPLNSKFCNACGTVQQ